MHRSGFVNILGRPNVGKSTLMNALVGERMSIITAKPQTTRHRIIGILSGDDFQIVFSDTPGFIRDPHYRMQNAMNRFALSTLEDADLLLFVTDVNEVCTEDDPLLQQIRKTEAPVILVLNKIDLATPEKVGTLLQQWNNWINFKAFFPISALHKKGTEALLKGIQEQLPEGPEYYPKDQLTDRPERFFVSEIIREKILVQYQQEIPYSVEVVVESFKETQTNQGEPLVRISAMIYVARESQKPIILGKAGAAIKKLGTAARKDLETFLEQKVFLELRVKVRENWRDDERLLKGFGYSG